MRREIIRSLVLWPALAAAAILSAGRLGELPGVAIDFLTERWGAVSLAEAAGLWPLPERITPASGEQIAAMGAGSILATSDALAVERAERGARAMRLPARLTGVFHGEGGGVEFGRSQFLLAPIRREQHEIAGLVLQPPGDIEVEGNSIDRPYQPAIATAGPALHGPLHDRVAKVTSSEPATQPALAVRSDLAIPPDFDTQPDFVTPRGPVAPDRSTDSILPRSIRTLGKLDSFGGRVTADTFESDTSSPTIADAIEPSADARAETGERPAGWPVTQALDEQLQSLIAVAVTPSNTEQLVSSPVANHAALQQWSDQVQATLKQLRSLPRIAHPAAGDLIASLDQLAEAGLRQAEKLDSREMQLAWLQASHAIARRTAVWRPIWELSHPGESSWVSDRETPATQDSLTKTILRLRSELPETGDAAGWTRYLLLNELERLGEIDDWEQRRITSQQFLSRLQWHGLADEHQAWLARPSVEQLVAAVRPWARAAVDYANLLAQIERQESNAIDLAAIDITGSYQSLRFAENPKATRIATALDTHYRNANIRTAISEAMLQRVLPPLEPREVPVRTRMLGSQVRGVSKVHGELEIDLEPSPNRWILRLKTVGKVASRTTGVNGPVAIHTRGHSHFVAETPIRVTPREVLVGTASADVSGMTRLRGIETDYDGWPLLGSLVRGYAESRFRSAAPTSNRIANRQIRSRVTEEMETRVDQQVNDASERLSELILGPLGKLRLDPKVIDLQTTQDRLLARYRLAGDWQLGAFTPRPRAPRSSLMSLQIHQSAINNTLEQLVPRDELHPIRETLSDGLNTFGIDTAELPEDIPDDVEIQFSRTRPITVEVADEQLWITLRVVRMTRGDHLDLRRFIVRALYRPTIDRLQAGFVREGHLRISGPGMSMRQRLPVRAIFNKVFSPNRSLPLTLPQLVDHPAAADLAVSQLELRDGWIALAISEADAPKLALKYQTTDTDNQTDNAKKR